MTRGAARRDGVRARADAGYSCCPAVAAEQKIRRTVRLRPGKARDVVTGQARRIGQPYVTRRARGARHIHVRGGELVAVEALPYDGVLHSHPRRADRRMTRGTVSGQGAVARVSRGRRAVCRVRESQIASARADSRLPCDSWLHYAVVARRAAGRVGPHGLARIHHARVAGCAQREHPGVLAVSKTVLRRLPRMRRGNEHTSYQHADSHRGTDARE